MRAAAGGDQRPLRVLLCATGFPRFADDGHKPFLLDHARALIDAGVEVTVLCPGGPGLASRSDVAGVEVHRFRYGPRRLENLAYDGAMYRRVVGPGALLVPAFVGSFLTAAVGVARRRAVDIVHGHWWAPTGAVAVAAAAVTGSASVVHVHGSDAAIAAGRARPLARRVLGRAGAVLAASDELAGWARELAERPVHVLPMPLATSRLPGPTPVPSSGPVLAVGRLVPEKGFDVLVRAMAGLGAPLVIVGDGPQRDELRALAEELAVDLTLPGAVAPSSVGEWYHRARVVAVPSLREGFGMVAAEAAYCARAVVGSAVGGLPVLIEDGVSGIAVPPGDVAALADGLRRVDPDGGRFGPARVRWLEPEAHAARVLQVYRDLVTGPVSGGAEPA